MKDKTRAIILDLLKDKAHEIKHQEFNGRSESQYKSFIELKEDRISEISDCINDLGLSNEWVSVNNVNLSDSQLCWVKFHDMEEVFLMRFVDYRKYGGGHNKWQDFNGQEEPLDGTLCVKIVEPLPPSEAKS